MPASAPFANDSRGSQQPAAQHQDHAHQHVTSSYDADSTPGGGNRKQEIVSKALCAADAETGAGVLPLAASAAKIALEEAGVQRQREEEEWVAAKCIMAEQQENERKQEEQQRRQHEREARAAEAAAARPPSAEAKETLAAGGIAVLPTQIAEEALEGMSKKELVLLLQNIATTKVLQANQLSGNPVNVAKKASKDKVSTCARIHMRQKHTRRSECACTGSNL